ncbi:MAG: sigma-70 family RNA polymerase sigma factor [Acidobacteriota bacterium]
MDADARAHLVERHLDVARRAALIIHPRVREHVELDELIALGNAGLAEAAQRFDPDRGVAFATFAWYRVQGAIIDGLRSSTNLPRRVWAQIVALRAANEYLEQRAEREVGARKTAAPEARPADALASIASALSAIRTMYVTSLETLQEKGFDTPDDTPPGEERVDGGRLARRLRIALRKLPDKERALVTKHYWEGKNLLEAGAELGISKSWASRLHAQAMDRLRVLVEDTG